MEFEDTLKKLQILDDIVNGVINSGKNEEEEEINADTIIWS